MSIENHPFIYGVAAKGDSFYDRVEECERIVKTLSGRNNLVLYAPRRFGKTSLVFKAMEQLEQQGFICIYFDFMPVFSLEAFVRLYAKALSSKQTNMQKFAQTFVSIVKSIRPVLGFGQNGLPEFSIDFAGVSVDETIVSQLLDMTEQLSENNRRILVFFDEFQEVEKLKGINFEDLLRSKIQQQQNVNYLFFGSKIHLMQEMFNDKKRAFYNAASQMKISHLPKQDTIKYIQKNFAKVSISISTEMIHYIITVTANIPHYLQLLASEIWQYSIDHYSIINKGIVDECVQRVLVLKGDYYMELFDRQSQSKKQLLQALVVNSKNIFSQSYLNKFNLPAASTLQRAVKGLTDDGIIDKIKDEYFISDPFFRLYIKSILM